jgi:drug/metabolite transporter (DMT)-like permease
MNQITQNRAALGAFYMVLAGITFAGVNAITYVITGNPEYGGLGFKSESDAFWQYAIALVFSLPFLMRNGSMVLKSKKPLVHVVRVVLAASGVWAFTKALSYGVPIWQVVALTMTAPFFVLIGAKFFLQESVTANRWIASAVGFAGALIVTHPWSEQFSAAWLLPVLAAMLWGGTSLLTKYLSRDETPESLTVWLLLLLTPINLAYSLGAGFEVPGGQILWMLVLGGFLVFLAQYLLSKSYATADANFVQPFDDLKLVSNVLIYGLYFGYWPQGFIWAGLAMIMGASLFLLLQENRSPTSGLKAA